MSLSYPLGNLSKRASRAYVRVCTCNDKASALRRVAEQYEELAETHRSIQWMFQREMRYYSK